MLGDHIRRRRRALGMSVDTLAQRSGIVSVTEVELIEQGAFRAPAVQLLAGLAKALARTDAGRARLTARLVEMRA